MLRFLKHAGKLAFVLALLAPAPSLADSITYKNARFGTQVTFPVELFTQTAPLPVNGDGISFSHPDGGSLAVWGANNALDDTPKTVAARMREQTGEDFSITYERIAKNWLVQSGFEDGMIYYMRLEFGRDDINRGFLMKYPEAMRSKYDGTLGPIGRSLGPG